MGHVDDVQARFMKHVRVNEATGCWEWAGANDSRGYGKFWMAGRSQRAHRVAFRLWRGRAARKDMVLLHRCDNPCCVNPAHLKEGTQRTNVRDMWAKGRAAWQMVAAA